MEKNIFEIATREAYRYPSVKGEITTEQLWDLPLSAKNGFDLDSVAKAVNQLVKENSEESFVVRSVNNNKSKYETMLEVVKHIIAVRMQENEAIAIRLHKKQERDRLLEILNQKEQQNLLNLSTEELRKRIEELS